MLRRIRAMYKMSQAAVVVQNLLEQHATALFPVDPAKAASQWVAKVHDDRSDLLDGRFGQWPHRVSVAAFALAHGSSCDPSDDARILAHVALGTIMADLAVNRAFYPFNGIDDALLGYAERQWEAGIMDLNRGVGPTASPSENAASTLSSTEGRANQRNDTSPTLGSRSAASEDLRRRIAKMQGA